MKLHFNKPQNTPAPSKMGLNIDIKSYLIKYIQSYLKWLSFQNPSFFKSLSSVEISNYFMEEIQAPIWFLFLLETNTFKIMTEVNHYISRYKNNVEIMAYELPIIPKSSSTIFSDIPLPNLANADFNQKEYVQQTCSGFSFDDYQDITYIDYVLCGKIAEFNLRKGTSL